MNNKKQPLRQCTGCGEMKPKKELVRIVKSPRGAYICRNAECYRKAVKAKRLERAFSAPIPESVSEQILKELSSDEQ